MRFPSDYSRLPHITPKNNEGPRDTTPPKSRILSGERIDPPSAAKSAKKHKDHRSGPNIGSSKIKSAPKGSDVGIAKSSVQNVVKAKGEDNLLKYHKVFDFLITEIMRRVEKEDIQGIFRISGSKLKVDEMQIYINAGKEVPSLEEYSIHDYISLFKQNLLTAQILSDQKESLLELGKKIENKNPNQPNQNIEICNEYKKMIRNLSKSQKAILLDLDKLLNFLLKKEVVEKTKMTSENLAIIFAPSFVNLGGSPLRNPLTQFEEAETAKVVVKFLMDNRRIIFDKHPPLPQPPKTPPLSRPQRPPRKDLNEGPSPANKSPRPVPPSKENRPPLSSNS